MKINSLSDLSALFERLSERGQSADRGRRGNRSSDEPNFQELRDSIRARRQGNRRGRGIGRGRSPGREVDDGNEPTPPETEPDTPPISTSPEPPVATNPEQNNDSKIDELAALYVKQYEEQAGTTLSDEAFAQKKAEVANFYSRFNDGTDRLDKVVFANDAVEA